jgi:hypothetical protein
LKFSKFVAIATRILNTGREEKEVHNLILPLIKFYKIFSVLFELSQDPVLWTDELTDRQTDRQIDR